MDNKLYEAISNSFNEVENYIRSHNYTFTDHRIEDRRAYIEFGKRDERTVGVMAIEQIEGNTGSFFIYEYRVLDLSVDDLIKLRRGQSGEGLSKVISQGYIRVEGPVVKPYGRHEIGNTNFLTGMLLKMFQETYTYSELSR
ncbi:hypothetical protein L3N51_01956 [Metallosphaera sp. J1]|uniref:hypothetical protein n=1 Tax=Metallosphaera javensis (ex Hofmann et al. 2022) TaxID=99938 RepID=UPI001EDDAB1C|nr:hypothetical protein [Metallosphaera javensis (ex Hofmann et al. 2022)]MCG3109661.1 hypothetical protein [Metallosphaera javensis (ex Hofmann et al. 2022)]